MLRKMWKIGGRYDKIIVLSYRYLATGGGVWMEVLLSFFVTVVGGVVATSLLNG